jgi:hypothetical protein
MVNRVRLRSPCQPVNETTGEAGETGAKMDEGRIAPAVMAAVGSVALSLYYYYVRGEKQRGQFVGLWPPTILGLATYIKLDEIEQLLQEHNE